MKVFSVSVLLIVVCFLLCISSEAAASRGWYRHASRHSTHDGSVGACFLDRIWYMVFGQGYVPRCLSPFSYHSEQTSGSYKWCAAPNGDPVPNSIALIHEFPYDCKKMSDCPPGTVIETSGRCQTTCAQAPDIIQHGYTFFCRDKCICPRGKYKNKDGKCVDFSDCQSEIYYCAAPKVYTPCGTRCPATCVKPDPGKCKEGCESNLNCVCPKGMVQFSSHNRTCLKKSDCPKCMNNAIPLTCSPLCPATCPGTPQCFGIGCRKDTYCGCPPGYVQLELSDTIRCVREKFCPPVCESPKVPAKCKSPCAATCDDLEPKCDEECSDEYICVCRDGYVQRSKTNDTCVMKSECPVCDPPKIPKGCGTACPPTCDDPEPICTKQCVPENICTCPDGYVQRSAKDRRCIRLHDCPVKCKAPKVFAECATKCPPTCQDPKPAVCSRACNPKVLCVCPPHLVQPDADTLTCIPLSECPQKCDGPKMFNKCPSKCQPTCEDQSPKDCEPGCAEDKCVCPPGLVLLSAEDDQCVKPTQCPLKCKAPKVSMTNPPACRPTCKDPGAERNCAEEPEERACVCPEGTYLISDKINRCVSDSKCQKYLGVTCEAPLVFSMCPHGCGQKTCDDLKKFLRYCPKRCGPDHCVCPEGQLYFSETDKRCVGESECPPKCDEPKVFVKCPTSCPRTCDDPNPKSCDKKCGHDQCTCPEGTVLLSLEDRQCVKPYECPVNCEEPKVFTECASKCPPTCAEPMPLVCSRACDPKVTCVCPIYMVQHSKTNRTCIKQSDCPTCKKPKIFVDCASKCRPTCQSPNPTICDNSCDDVNCVCPPGMVHPKNGDDSCIDLSDCPESCKFPLVATKCASVCPATCDDPLPKCNDSCTTEIKCVCPKGLLRLSKKNNTCVLPSQCPNLPKDCGLRKEPTRCASGCPATCENKTPRFCTKDCNPDVNCECPQGMVQRSLEDTTCLWPDDCEQ